MSNEQMKKGRFLKWHTARKKVQFITQQVANGRTVYLSTALRTTKITTKHLSMIEARKSGLYIQHGKSWLNYDGATIRAVA